MPSLFSSCSEFVVLGVFATVGCAARGPLDTEMSVAFIRSAEELGATTVPRAAVHLQLAKEELEAAAALDAEGDTRRAGSLLRRAEADAELAIALSRADADKQAAAAAMARVRDLQSQNPYALGGAN